MQPTYSTSWVMTTTGMLNLTRIKLRLFTISRDDTTTKKTTLKWWLSTCMISLIERYFSSVMQYKGVNTNSYVSVKCSLKKFRNPEKRSLSQKL